MLRIVGTRVAYLLLLRGYVLFMSSRQAGILVKMEDWDDDPTIRCRVIWMDIDDSEDGYNGKRLDSAKDGKEERTRSASGGDAILECLHDEHYIGPTEL